ncbi:hypothetical protein [Brucella tritici]|uniref:Uncharacterized protein n=1 Tax=Brucella tritici TaxID=94626 RepID=A0A6L3YVG7_9HYPH|nr:hypothetical protein [Brucella tritici]KAB2689551.1 hypothetical protein F9L08_02510 [Brucella tritici]
MMKTIALLAVGAFMAAGTAFATVPTNGNVPTHTVKSDKSTGVIVANGNKKPGLGFGSTTNRGLKSSIFGG